MYVYLSILSIYQKKNVYLCWFWFLLFIFWLELCAIILKTVNNIMYVSIYICMYMYVYIHRTN